MTQLSLGDGSGDGGSNHDTMGGRDGDGQEEGDQSRRSPKSSATRDRPSKTSLHHPSYASVLRYGQGEDGGAAIANDLELMNQSQYEEDDDLRDHVHSLWQKPIRWTGGRKQQVKFIVVSPDSLPSPLVSMQVRYAMAAVGNEPPDEEWREAPMPIITESGGVCSSGWLNITLAYKCRVRVYYKYGVMVAGGMMRGVRPYWEQSTRQVDVEADQVFRRFDVLGPEEWAFHGDYLIGKVIRSIIRPFSEQVQLIIPLLVQAPDGTRWVQALRQLTQVRSGWPHNGTCHCKACSIVFEHGNDDNGHLGDVKPP